MLSYGIIIDVLWKYDYSSLRLIIKIITKCFIDRSWQKGLHPNSMEKTYPIMPPPFFSNFCSSFLFCLASFANRVIMTDLLLVHIFVVIIDLDLLP